jgi:hypothetical protein
LTAQPGDQDEIGEDEKNEAHRTAGVGIDDSTSVFITETGAAVQPRHQGSGNASFAAFRFG